MSRRAIVTGATGFVGSNLVRRLIEDGWQVSIITRDNSNYDKLDGLEGQISTFTYDGTVERMLEIFSIVKPDIVFHTAALVLTDHQPDQIDALILSNILFGTHLLEAMDKNQVNKMINTGTSWQHFEDAEYDPVCLYAATKQAFEAILTYYSNVKGIKIITLKLLDNYGAGDTRPKLLALLNKLRQSTNQTLGMTKGEQIINLVHIRDVTNAYLVSAERLLNNWVQEYESYSVSTEERLSVKQLVELIEEILELKLPIEWGARPYREREVMIPWSSDLKLPGWEPEVSLRAGLQKYLT